MEVAHRACGHCTNRCKHRVVLFIEVVEDVVVKLIIVDGAAGGDELGGEALHLVNVLIGGHVDLFGVGERRTEVSGVCPRSLDEHGVDETPHLSGMLHADRLGEDLRRDTADQVGQHLLIPDEPGIVGRVGDGRGLAILFHLHHLGRHWFTAVSDAKEAGTSERREDHGLPEKMFSRVSFSAGGFLRVGDDVDEEAIGIALGIDGIDGLFVEIDGYYFLWMSWKRSL
jgi:hypothetical protein